MAKEKRDATIVPGMRYKDAPAAVEWLCNVFGFEKKLVVPGPDNTIAHAELTFGNGMVMLGSADKEDLAKPAREAKLGGLEMSIYVIVSDADGHYARAKARGAKIVSELEDKGYGGKGYASRDLEGNIWYFGSYDPWAEA
jgi:uncharacterized glyoxalase superfamily protein PhnB